MNMPVIAIVMGLLLCLDGIAGEAHHMMTATGEDARLAPTALIPLFVGLIFVALGAASLAKPTLRKHFMHALAAIALLSALAAAGRLASTWTKPGVSPVARGSQVAMALLCAATVGLCVKSFVDARRAREAAATPMIDAGPTIDTM